MAVPNGTNPEFLGLAKAAAFDGLHGNGVSVTAVSTNGTTNVNIFDDTVGFNGSVTGVYIIDKASTVGTITLKGNAGTVCTIVMHGTAGFMKGATSLSNTTLYKDGSLVVVSSVADRDAYVFVTTKATS